MSIVKALKSKIRSVAKRPGPRVLTVKRTRRLTPNMIRVTFAGPELAGFPAEREGGNCKLLLPEQGETRDAFVARLASGPSPVRRTYTIRAYRAERMELDIDFVAHGENGPASRWATHAKEGDFLGFMGPSTPKLADFRADWYLLAADLSALPVAAATLEAMPRDAKGVAIFEVTAQEDWQDIAAPDGIAQHWLIHPNANEASSQQEELIRRLEWPAWRVQTCIAGESSVIRALLHLVRNEKGIAREDAYVSGYWKIGLVEDEHQQMKQNAR